MTTVETSDRHMGASVGQCLMSNIIRVVGPDEEGTSI